MSAGFDEWSGGLGRIRETWGSCTVGVELAVDEVGPEPMSGFAGRVEGWEEGPGSTARKLGKRFLTLLDAALR